MSRTCTSDVFFVMIARMALFYQPVLAQRRDINPNKPPIHPEGCTGKATGQTDEKVVNWMGFYQGNEKEFPFADPEIPVESKDKLALRSIVPGYTSTDTSSGTRLMSHNGFIEYLQTKEIRLKVLYSDQLIKSQRLGESRHEGMMQADAPMKHSPVLTKTNRPQKIAADPKKCEKKGKGVVPGVKNRNSGAFVTSISRCTAKEARGSANGTSFRRCCITDAGFTHYRRGEKENGVLGRRAEDHEEVE